MTVITMQYNLDILIYICHVQKKKENGNYYLMKYMQMQAFKCVKLKN